MEEGADSAARGGKVSSNHVRDRYGPGFSAVREFRGLREGPSGRRIRQRSNRFTEPASRNRATLHSRINSTISLDFFRSQAANPSISLSRLSRSYTLSGALDQ